MQVTPREKFYINMPKHLCYNSETFQTSLFFFFWPNKTFYLSIYTNKYLKIQHCNSNCHVNVPARVGKVPFFKGLIRINGKILIFSTCVIDYLAAIVKTLLSLKELKHSKGGQPEWVPVTSKL
jgi:hypothetical protein